MFNAIAKPFGWLLMKFYEWTGNYGIAVILFAVVVKLVLLPFQMKSKRSMMQTSRLQPKMKEIEKKHGANKQKYNEEIQKLYREEKINPMSGCIWSLIPFPILIALYQAIRQPITCMMGVAAELLNEGGSIAALLDKTGFSSTINASYAEIAKIQWISKPEFFDQFAALSDRLRQIDYSFLSMDLGANPSWRFLWTTDWSDISVWGPGLLMFLVPILAALAGFLSSKISTKMNGTTGDAQTQSSMSAMLFIMPLFSLYIGFIMPTALGLYWLISTVLSTIQEVILTKYYKKKMAIEDAAKNELLAEREAELEEKRRETERKKAENATERNPNTSKRKQHITERQEQLEKAAEWERINNPKPAEEVDPSQEGTRRYARGRAYDPYRYSPKAESEETAEASAEPDETPEIAEECEPVSDAEEAVAEETEESVSDEFEEDDTND